MVKYYLVVEEGLLREKIFPLTEKLTIGRGEGSDIQLSDPFVSKEHALVYLVGSEPEVKDLASLNGTFVNGERVRQSGLRGGDTIRVGNTAMRVILKAAIRQEPGAEDTQEIEKQDVPAETAAEQTRVLERFLNEAGKEGIPHKVLIADDEEPIRDLLREFLAGVGYEVLAAANGEEALELAQRERPDLILLDIRMPKLDGIETCVRLKTIETTRSIPVIIATAFGDTLAEALDAGVDDFVSKPFQLEEIGLRIKSLLRVRHLTNELERAAAYIGELQKHRPKH